MPSIRTGIEPRLVVQSRIAVPVAVAMAKKRNAEVKRPEAHTEGLAHCRRKSVAASATIAASAPILRMIWHRQLNMARINAPPGCVVPSGSCLPRVTLLFIAEAKQRDKHKSEGRERRRDQDQRPQPMFEHVRVEE